MPDVQPVGISLEQLKPMFCEAVEAVQEKWKKKDVTCSLESIAKKLVLKDLFWARSSILGDEQAVKALLLLIDLSVTPSVLVKFKNCPAIAEYALSKLPSFLFGADGKPLEREEQEGGTEEHPVEVGSKSPVREEQRLKKFHGESSLFGWLHVVAQRLVLTALRNSHLEQLGKDADRPGNGDHVGEGSAEELRKALIGSLTIALQSLPPREKSMFVQRIFFGKSNQDAAFLLKLPPATASTAFTNAKALILRHPAVREKINRLAELTDAAVADIESYFLQYFLKSLMPLSPEEDSEFHTDIEPFLN